jgi:hypothetical protein
MQKERIIDLVSKLVNTLASPKISLDERHTPTLYAGFLTGLLKRVGTEVRKNKKMRLDRDQQQLRNGDDMDACTSPPTSSRDSSSSSPLSGTASTGSFNDVNASWNGNGYLNGQNTICAFPNNGTNTSGYHPPTDSSKNAAYNTNDSIYPSTVTHVGSTPSWGSNNLNTNMTWDEVYAAPDSNSHTPSNTGHPNTLSGHTMHMGTQWNFSADENSPYAKWSMEDLCPTVNYLMPST